MSSPSDSPSLDETQKKDEDSEKLHNLARWGHHLVLGFLLKGKSVQEVNEPDSHGWTPLHHAACYGHKDTIKVLLTNGAKPDQVDNVGWTPLHHASTQNHYECVQLLLETGMNPDIADQKGMTSLHHVCRLCNKELAKLLMSSGASSELKDSQGHTPADYCPENETGLHIKFMIKNFQGFLKKEATGQKRKEEEKKRKELEAFEYPFRVGWAHKSKKKNSSQPTSDKWQKRWLRLKRGILEYYDTKEDQQVYGSDKRKGFVSLETVTSNPTAVDEQQSKRANTWSLETPDRVFWFACDSAEERDGWVEDIKITAEHLKESKQAPGVIPPLGASPKPNRKSVQLPSPGSAAPISAGGSSGEGRGGGGGGGSTIGGRKSVKAMGPLDLDAAEKQKKSEPLKGWIKVSPRAAGSVPPGTGTRKGHQKSPSASGIVLASRVDQQQQQQQQQQQPSTPK